MGEERKILREGGYNTGNKGRKGEWEEALSREIEGRGRMGGDEERDNSP